MNRLFSRVPGQSWRTSLAVTLVFTAVLSSSDARAQDAAGKKLGWFFKASVGWVWLGGNSESNSFAVGAEARRVWEKSELSLKAGGTQTESSFKTRTAVGTANDYVLREFKRTDKTAELYFARVRYDYSFNKYFFAFGGADWNLDNTKDVRIDCKNELPVSISDNLKFKPALQFLWRNDPALTEVELFDTGGTSTGTKVSVPLEELDTIFTVSLVFEM